jgi:alpha,alpha-trehalase
MSAFRSDFQKVFYVKEESGWYDYNLKTSKHNLNFYASIIVPLFTRCYHSMNRAKSERIFQKMEQMGVFNYTGGVPTSLNKNTREQWDFPNGWSPLNHMMIEGLRQSDNPRMQEKAFWLAEKWVLSNYRVFTQSQAMWEKYNVIGSYPSIGHGGEYSVQVGSANSPPPLTFLFVLGGFRMDEWRDFGLAGHV